MEDKGLFIAVEGPEGSGKSSVCDFLVQMFKDKGHDPVLTREPGGTEAGEKIREILLLNSSNLNDRAELFLFLASRSIFVEEVVSKSLSEGKVVISDRFDFSTIAYQGSARGLPVSFVKKSNEFAKGDIEPDLYILLLVDVKEGRKRQMMQGKDKDRMENESDEFHNRVLAGYKSLEDSAQNVFTVDTTDLHEIEVCRKVRKEIEKRFF